MRDMGADDMPSEGARDEPAPVLQWVGLFLPVTVFFAHLQIGYVTIPWACTTHGDFWVHAEGISAVLLSAAGTGAAWRTWMRAGRSVPGEDGGSLPRTRFLGAIGLGAGANITLILFAQWVAGLFIGSCQ